MNSAVVCAYLTENEISANELANQIASESCGAVVTFSGTVRDNDHGKTVVNLTYEAHPTSEQILQEVTNEVAMRYPVIRVAVAHRFGEIPIGQSALAIAVASPHREDAFRACAELVDEVKRRIPIWKYQRFSDGSDEWVNFA